MPRMRCSCNDCWTDCNSTSKSGNAKTRKAISWKNLYVLRQYSQCIEERIFERGFSSFGVTRLTSGVTINPAIIATAPALIGDAINFKKYFNRYCYCFGAFRLHVNAFVTSTDICLHANAGFSQRKSGERYG